MNSVPVADPLYPNALHDELCSDLEAAKTVPGGPLQTDAYRTQSVHFQRHSSMQHAIVLIIGHVQQSKPGASTCSETMKATHAAC